MQETTVVLPEIVTDLEKIEEKPEKNKQVTHPVTDSLKLCGFGGITMFRGNDVR